MPSSAEIERLKKRAAAVSVAYNLIATLTKIVAAVLTGSVSLLSEAVHSGTDIISSLLAYGSIRMSATPADDEHPFGHGKVESLAGLGESIMLIAIVSYIAFESVMKLIHGGELQALGIGLWVMAGSTVTSLFVALYVTRVGKQTDSLALIANGQHLFVDCVTSAGVVLALLVVLFTGSAVADPLIALLLAVWMGYGAVQLCRRAFHELIDVRLPQGEIDRICAILEGNQELISFHKLRTRRSGSVRHIDVHIVVPSDWSLVRAHDLADSIEKTIETELSPAQAVIHVDPYEVVKDKPV